MSASRRQNEDWSTAILGRSSTPSQSDWDRVRSSFVFAEGEHPVAGSKGWLAGTTPDDDDQPCVTLLTSRAIYLDVRPHTFYSGRTLIHAPLDELTQCTTGENDVGGTTLTIALSAADRPVFAIDLPRGHAGERFGSQAVDAWREVQTELGADMARGETREVEDRDLAHLFYELSTRLDEEGVAYALDFGSMPLLAQEEASQDSDGDRPDTRVLRRDRLRDYEHAPMAVTGRVVAHLRDQGNVEAAIDAMWLALENAIIWPEYLVATGQHPRLTLKPEAGD